MMALLTRNSFSSMRMSMKVGTTISSKLASQSIDTTDLQALEIPKREDAISMK